MRCVAAVLFLLPGIGWAAGQRDVVAKPELQQAIAAAMNPANDAADKWYRVQELASGLSVPEQRWLLQKALNVAKTEKDRSDSPPSARLFSALGQAPSPELLPDLTKAWESVPKARRDDVLKVVFAMKTRGSAVVALELLKKGGPTAIGPDTLSPLGTQEALARVYFPELWDLAVEDAIDPIVRVWLHYRDRGTVRTIPADAQDRLFAEALALKPQVEKRQNAKDPSFRFDDEYIYFSAATEVLLDAMTSMDAKRAAPVFKWATTLQDPNLAAWGALGQLSAGVTPAPDAIDRICRAPDVRDLFVRLAERRGKLSAIPAKWRTPQMMAEADMAQWLAYPTELGQPPDELVLAKVVSREDQDWYVYKFRIGAGPFADKGWMVGISGPWKHGTAEKSDRVSDTFSDFEPFEGKTAEQHFEEIRGTVEKGGE